MSEHGIVDKLGRPEIEEGAWVAPGAVLVGKIIVRRGASVWYGCVLRSDMEGAVDRRSARTRTCRTGRSSTSTRTSPASSGPG